jgi:hypothetical protein
MMDVYDFVGLIGVFLTLYSYARVQWQRDYAKHLNYSLINFVGTVLFAVSFLKHWNLSSFVCNSIWGGISVYGMYRCFKYMRQGRMVEARLANQKSLTDV